ncbi:MAG: hypothetical protein J6M60_07100 [Clostridia bacterium]|nr:hypothetical protein [Clostridia bacterium]
MHLQNFQQFKEMALEVVKLSSSEFNGAYCSKDEKLLFVDQCVFYVVPWTRSAIQILEDYGFVRKKMPFTKGFVIPTDKLDLWDKIEKQFKEKPV